VEAALRRSEVFVTFGYIGCLAGQGTVRCRDKGSHVIACNDCRPFSRLPVCCIGIIAKADLKGDG
jgi:hypothetical protein